MSIELLTDDQDRALESLRNGTAIAVVTSEAHPVSGARATPLGAMRYIAVTSPALAASLGSVGFETSLQSAPVIFYDRKDTLQDRFLASFGIGPEVFTGLVHYAPSPTAMIDLAARGLGGAWRPNRWHSLGSIGGKSSRSLRNTPSTFRFIGSPRPSVRRFSRGLAPSYGKRPQ